MDALKKPLSVLVGIEYRDVELQEVCLHDRAVPGILPILGSSLPTISGKRSGPGIPGCRFWAAIWC